MPRRGIDRREFLKAALAIGGASALSACVAREGAVEVPRGNPDDLPDRQFAWNEFLPTGPHGNVRIPNHQLILLLDYRRSGVPVPGDRERVEAALRSVERAYQWGTGDEFNPGSTRGLLSMLGYAPRYFDRFDADLLEGAGMRRPEAIIEELGEDADPDRADAVLVLSSDEVQVLLSAEQALRGEFDALNGVVAEAALTDTFEVAERRTGFLGVGRPARNLEADVPEHSPTAMGYRSGFKDNQASEDRVAASIGGFADGTTLQLSRLTFDLDSWYDREETERVHRMFSPEHTPREVGEIGEHLGGRSRISRESAERTDEDAREHGVVGHTQKVARARDEEFEPKLLRRSEGVSTDLPEPSMNFASLQRYVEVRRAMNGADVAADVEEENDGIRRFVDVRTRGIYLVPPRSLRALPTPGGDP